MNPTSPRLDPPSPAIPAPAPRAGSRAVWVAGGVLAIIAVGAAFALVVRNSPGPVSAADADVKPVAAATKPAAPAARPAAPRAAAVATCGSCGVVESVTAVQAKGEGTGLGAVAGGVLGGVVGNQMGGGSGKTAMTVIGAVGGGLAGHEVEKRARATTSYVVKVRMDDKTLQTLTLPTAPKKGDRVAVEGGKLRALPAAAAPQA